MPALECLECSSPQTLSDSLDTLALDVFRTDFSRPGFSVLSFQQPLTPRELRAAMVNLKQKLSAWLESHLDRRLSYLSMGRFNQQTTTKFHLDGAPEESVLMLGYEPTAIQSRLFMADYTRCAHDNGLSVRRFLDERNPMFSEGARLLQPYVSPVACFDPTRAQIVLINNSSNDPNGQNLLGVMHQAIIDKPDGAQRRLVNSTMLAVSTNATDLFTHDAQQAFIENEAISGR